MRGKVVILTVCLLGISAVCYGMVTKDHAAFIIGLALVVAGYLMIRRKLKAHMREKYSSERDLT
ncbi:MAG: hypothetical protein ACM34H_08195 [Deltaproteobacteria bacterium]